MIKEESKYTEILSNSDEEMNDSARPDLD